MFVHNCGMDAVNFGVIPLTEAELEAIDDRLRETVPMGFDVHDDTNYHLVEHFPWKLCQLHLDQFTISTGIPVNEDFMGYGEEYFQDLCERVGADPMRVINSVGTLGGGNHFIEFDRDTETDELWSIIHSGSRGIGLKIAQYHQERAENLRTSDHIRETIDDELAEYVVPSLDDPELASWFLGGKGRSYIDSDAIRTDYDGEDIGRIHDEIRTAHPDKMDGNSDLEGFVGEEMCEYIQDMMFAQAYASQSRGKMQFAVRDAIESVLGIDAPYQERIESVHNYTDPTDGVLRKGACAAREGQQIVVPLNMSDGVLLCEAEGNDDWNRSAPHGSGRIMSRTQAYDEGDIEEFKAEMEGIVSSSVTESTLDESPHAYKDASLIQNAIQPTATITRKLEPVLNVKALD